MYASASPNRSVPHQPYGGGGGFATPIRTPSTSYRQHSNAAYSQALTPASSSSKEVRFQNQPLPQQTQQSQQTVAVSKPNKSPYYNNNAVSAPSSSGTAGAVAQRTTSALSSGASSAAKVVANTMPATTRISTAASTIALNRRLKWNLSALALLWILPVVTTKPRDVYWSLLDVVYMHVGGEADEIVDGVIGWIIWAISVVLLFNAVEAGVLMRRASSAPTTQPSNAAAGEVAKQGAGGAVLGMHSPQVAKSINFVAASRMKGSPKTRVSNVGAGSPISHSDSQQQTSRSSPSGGSPVVDYSQFSPSLRRTGSPVSSPSHNGFGAGGSARLGNTPTSSGIDYNPGFNAATSSSPLAAFRARHSTGGGSPSPSSIRTRSITPSVSSYSNNAEVDLSFDGADAEGGDGETFLGDESFEVDKALKSLRNSLPGVSSTPAPFVRRTNLTLTKKGRGW